MEIESMSKSERPKKDEYENLDPATRFLVRHITAIKILGAIGAVTVLFVFLWLVQLANQASHVPV
jgi:hypothetical protein